MSRDDANPHKRGSSGKINGKRTRKPNGEANHDANPTDPGPRPVSLRQQQLRALMRGEVPPAPPPPSAPARNVAPRPDPTTLAEGTRVVRFRDAGASRSRKRVKKQTAPTNRRIPNYRGIIGGIFVAAVFATAIGFLLKHPKLEIQSLAVQGQQAISEEWVLKQMKEAKGRNLFLAPVGKVEMALLKEPTFEKVAVRRVWPNKLVAQVTERQPWASVQLPDGGCYTIDEKLVPFRQTEKPEKGLPRLMLSTQEDRSKPVALGKTMTAAGLSEVYRCLAWADARADFPVESVSIDPTGKLCLNRKGGVQVRLGSELDLDRKLETLDLLIARRPDLKASAEIAYVNLYAFDAPAVMPRVVSPSQPKASRSRSLRDAPTLQPSAPSETRTL